MQELKKQTMEIINNINQEWVDSLREGEQKGGIDLGEMFAKYSAQITKLDQAFREADERSPAKKKGRW